MEHQKFQSELPESGPCHEIIYNGQSGQGDFGNPRGFFRPNDRSHFYHPYRHPPPPMGCRGPFPPPQMVNPGMAMGPRPNFESRMPPHPPGFEPRPYFNNFPFRFRARPPRFYRGPEYRPRYPFHPNGGCRWRNGNIGPGLPSHYPQQFNNENGGPPPYCPEIIPGQTKDLTYTYTPRPIQHFPILQLYNKSNEPSDVEKCTSESEPQVDEYCPHPIDRNSVMNGYAKLKRGSVGSTGSNTSLEEEQEGVGDNGFSNHVQAIKDLLNGQGIQSKFVVTSETKEANDDESQSLVVSSSPNQSENQGMRRMEMEKSKCIIESHQQVSISSNSPVRTRMENGLYNDGEGFVEVYIYGVLESFDGVSDQATYGIWFADDHPWNIASRISHGERTGTRALIHGALKALSLLRENGFHKVKLITDSSFLFNNVPNWMEKVLASASEHSFTPTNWMELKYKEEICELCKLLEDTLAKWALVDSKCVGTRKAKTLANNLKKIVLEEKSKNEEFAILKVN